MKKVIYLLMLIAIAACSKFYGDDYVHFSSTMGITACLSHMLRKSKNTGMEVVETVLRPI